MFVSVVFTTWHLQCIDGDYSSYFVVFTGEGGEKKKKKKRKKLIALCLFEMLLAL